MRYAASALRYRLYILGAAVLFSTGGAAIKACSLSGWQVGAFRSAVAALTLALLVPASRRGWSRRSLLVAASYAATLVLFVLANKLTTAANAIFLQSAAPLYVLGLGPVLLGERATRRDLVFMALIAGGLALFFAGAEPVRASAPRPWLGNVLAATAGLTWGLTLVGLRLAGRSRGTTGAAADSGLSSVVAGNLLATLVCLPFALGAPSGAALGLGAPAVALSLRDVSLIGYLGVIQVGLAYVLLTRGLRHVSALEGSLLVLLEPTLNPLWAWLVQREVPSGQALAGGAVILGVTLARSLAPALARGRDVVASPHADDPP